MPAPNSNLQFYGLDKPTLPYRSNTSIVDESPHWVTGSQNTLATISGWVEKRPGFSTPIEYLLSVIPGTIVRIFPWRRWNGSFFVMVCATTATTSTVWKYEVGKDSSFILIFTSTGFSLAINPFDFIVSNNICFFGNGSTRANMRKFDGTNTSLWGIDPYNTAPTFSLISGILPNGISFNTTSGVFTGTPTATGQTTVTVTVTDAVGATSSQTLALNIVSSALGFLTPAGPIRIATNGSAYSLAVGASGGSGTITFGLASGSLPPGITLATNGYLTGTPTAVGNYSFSLRVTDALLASSTRGFSIFVSSAVVTMTPTSLPAATAGVAYSQALTTTGGTGPYTYAVVGGGLPSGLTLSSAGVISGTLTITGTYTFTISSTDAGGLATEILYTLVVNSTTLNIPTTPLPQAKVGDFFNATVSVSGGTSPYSFTYAAGAISAQTGYVYGQTYTSVTAHESSMSPLSISTGPFTDQDPLVNVTPSTDPQVNGINLYRSSDGGTKDPGSMRLIASLTNTTQSYTDTTPDVFLGSKIGPGLYVNDPPQPLWGFVWSNGRIWGKKDAKTWFTGNEEVTNGVAEECMSDAINGNFYAWPAEVGAITATPEGVDIGLSTQFWQVSGDQLSSFRKQVLLTGGGCRYQTNICAIGSTAFWMDTSKQLFSSGAGEIGLAIRPDFANIDPTQTFVVYHKSKLYNWVCVLDAKNGKLFTYDIDLNQWNTPWTVPGMTCIASGEVSLGNIQLIAGFQSGHVMTLTPGTFGDDNATYSEALKSNLVAIVPGRSTTARNTAEVRRVSQYEMEVNTTFQQDGSYTANLPNFFGALVDDDPIQSAQANYFDLTQASTPLQYTDTTIQKRYILANRWVSNLTVPGRRVAFMAVWNAAGVGWRMYSFDLGWERTG